RGDLGRRRRVRRIQRVRDARHVAVIAQARDGLPLLGEFDRIVQVRRDRVGRTALQVAQARRRARRRRGVARADQRLARDKAARHARLRQRRTVARTVAIVILVVVAVVAELGADQQRVLDRTRIELGRQLGLVEQRVITDAAVMALQAHRQRRKRQIAVGQRREHARRIDRTYRVGRCLARVGLHVVELCLVAQSQVGRELVIDIGRERRHILRGAVVGVAVVRLGADVDRVAVEVRQAVIGHVAVVLQQRGQRHLGRCADAETPRRGDAEILRGHLVARARLAVLRHRGDAEGRSVRRRRVDVGGGTHQAVGGDRTGDFRRGLQLRLLRHLVDDTARRTAAEQHRRRTHQHFHRIEGKQVAVVLAAIPEAVEVDV
ncbi:hypothetical protein COLO4_01836, partial [Corchorus olitorius]